MNTTPERIPNYSRIIIMQLENHKLIRSGVINSTELQVKAHAQPVRCTARKYNRQFLSEQTNAKRIKKVGQKGENLQATQKLKKIPQCYIRS